MFFGAGAVDFSFSFPLNSAALFDRYSASAWFLVIFLNWGVIVQSVLGCYCANFGVEPKLRLVLLQKFPQLVLEPVLLPLG